MPEPVYPPRVWATRDVDGRIVLVQDGCDGIRSIAFHDPFADDAGTGGDFVDGKGCGRTYRRDLDIEAVA